MVDNTYYNHGLELTMDEQDVFIDILGKMHSATDFFNAGIPYTPYIPFVLELTSYYINALVLVRFLLFCH